LESGRLTVTDVQALKTPQQMSNSTRVFMMMILPIINSGDSSELWRQQVS